MTGPDEFEVLVRAREEAFEAAAAGTAVGVPGYRVSHRDDPSFVVVPDEPMLSGVDRALIAGDVRRRFLVGIAEDRDGFEGLRMAAGEAQQLLDVEEADGVPAEREVCERIVTRRRTLAEAMAYLDEAERLADSGAAASDRTVQVLRRMSGGDRRIVREAIIESYRQMGEVGADG